MVYQDSFLTQLDEINELVRANKINGQDEALDKFSLYLENIKNIGEFNPEEWKSNWRKKIWEFGELFRKTNPRDFLKIVENKMADESINSKEIFEFISSEIAYNFLPDIECKLKLKEVIKKYPLNPEFRNTLGHFYSREKMMLEAIEEYCLAFKIDSKNYSFLENRFHMDQNYLNFLIKNGEYYKGNEYIQKLLIDSDYLKSGNNIRESLVDFSRRIADHMIFENKLKQLEADFKVRMQNELDSERKRIIEVLGFFSAIVAFILSTVSIGKGFTFMEAIFFIIALGLILILFAVSLSTLFNSSNNNLLKDKKFWILIIGLLLILLFILSTQSIATILNNFVR